MKIIVLGSSGQIGFEMVRSMQTLGEIRRTPRDMVDLTRPGQIAPWLAYTRPQVVVNAAAMTAVDRIEHQPEIADAVNGTAVGVLAEECRRAGALLVHLSTDYVFDGESETPYPETAAPAPLNTYGRSKLLGDRLIEASGCRHLILRVGAIYSWRRANFLLSILAHAREKGEVRAIADHVASPTPAWLVADIAARMIARYHTDSNLGTFQGVVNVSCSETISWHGFANAIVDSLIAEPSANPRVQIEGPPRVTPIKASEFPGKARRPKRAHLDLGRLREDWQIFPPHWKTGLEITLRNN